METNKMNFSTEETTLKAGEKALSQGDYQSAIAHFQKVSQNTNNPTLFSSAQRSLLSAYIKSGQTEAAISLCQQLQKTGDVQDQVWATTQLNQLKTAKKSSNVTGFVADNEQKKIPDQQVQKQTKTNRKKPQKTAEETQTNKESSALLAIGRNWRNAPRAENWKPLKKTSLSRLWRRIIISLVVFGGVFYTSIKLFMETTNDLLVELPNFRPFQPFYREPTVALLVFSIIIFMISPWLLTRLLKFLYQCQPFPLYKLNTRCLETAKFLQKYCRQNKLPFPTLSLLPTKIPLIFSYGQTAKNAHIVLSEGLLTKLEDEEIATLLAGEIGMIHYSPLFIFSGAIALLQVPYTLYFQIAYWGETLFQKLPKKPPRFLPQWLWRDIPPLIRHSSAYFSSLFYLAYRLWQLPLNLLFQTAHYYRDYFSVSPTGNPNAKVRALIKIALGITEEIEAQKHTPYCLESFNPLLPLNYRQGLHLGSLAQYLSLETILNEEGKPDNRHYLNWFNSHPHFSDRAFYLSQFAKYWNIPFELDISPPTPSSKQWGERLKKLTKALSVFPLLQRSLYIGMIVGLLLRFLLWLIGIISGQLDFLVLVWLIEGEFLALACILVTFSLAIILSINHYFPNIKVSSQNNNPTLYQWLKNTKHPQTVHSLRIKGQILGRSGISNWLGQDLILKTETGIVFLNISSRLGMIGNILPNFSRPNQFIEQPVIVSGWLRRSLIPWIDVERITNHQRQTLQASYPIWLTLLAIFAAFWGTHLILQS